VTTVVVVAAAVVVVVVVVVVIIIIIIIIMILDQCLSGKERVQRFCKHRNETLGSTEYGDFPH